MLITVNNTSHVLDANTYLDQGAEAKIYTLRTNAVIKFINESHKTENKINKILALCDKADQLTTIKGFENIAIPIHPAYQNNTICGFSMSFFKGCKTINELCYDIFSNTYNYKSVNDKTLISIIENLFNSLQILHRQKIILGDINSNNILWNPKTDAIHIIDLDSAKVGDYHASMSTPEYLCPIVKQLGEDSNGGLSYSTSSDIYALTIICFEMLFGFHPHDIGIQPTLSKQEKMAHGITYLSYHFTKNQVYKRYKIFKNDNQMTFKRLDMIKQITPNLYNHFVDVFHKNKRDYFSKKLTIKQPKTYRKRHIKAIRTSSKGKILDPKEFHYFLNTYNLKLPL